MRKAMIEEMLEKAMCYDGKVIKDYNIPTYESVKKLLGRTDDDE